MWRILLSAMCYSLRPMIIYVIITIVYNGVSWIVAVPGLLNVVASFSAFFTDISYSFDANNHF